MCTEFPMKKVISVTWRSRACLLCHVHQHNTHTHVHTSIPTPTLVFNPVPNSILTSKWKEVLGKRLHPHPDTNTPTSMHAYKTHTDLCCFRSRWSHYYRLLEGRRLKDRWPCPTGHMGREDANLWENLQGPLGEEKIQTVFWDFHVWLSSADSHHT